MRFIWMFLVAFWLIPFVAQSQETALKEIRSQQNRLLQVEPEYKNEPTYSLLIDGPNAEKRTWIVLDGFEILYADLNQNGNLTEGRFLVVFCLQDGLTSHP